ncbi:MAG: sugar ABC transporter permease [Lachnospiraceae bacterium]|jgi:putative multiple sugar transport system permease protein|nr:sugar ABC transporter permease [Lachnospiraceae bacterium]
MNRSTVMGFVKKYTMVLALIVLVIFFTVRTDGSMLLPQNINNLIAQNAYVYILATGMLLCILTGGNIDLSVGSLVCLVGSIGGTMMVTKHMGAAAAIPVMLLAGILVGVWQGFWIAYRRIPPFIVTLAGMLAFRGISNVVLDGLTLAPMPDNYLNLFNGYIVDFMKGDKINMSCMVIGVVAVVAMFLVSLNSRRSKAKKGYSTGSLAGQLVKLIVIGAAIIFFAWKLANYKGIPYILVWLAVIIAVYAYITSRTTVGRHFYAIGGNEKAAKLSGINTNRVYFLAYANMGFLAAVAAMVTIARLNSANPTAGTNYEMDAIGSCFVGGASAYGGSGTVPGVVIGATLMGVINLGMSIMGVDANWQKVVKGLVLLAAVIFDVESKKLAK